MKKIIQKHGLIFVLLLSQFFVAFFSFLDDSIIGNGFPKEKALTMHFIGLFLIVLGYILNRYSIREINVYTLCFSKNFYKISYLLVILGLSTSILTIGAIISPSEYLANVINNEGAITENRLESGSEGLSGIFKMMNQLPLAFFLLTSAIQVFTNLKAKDKKRIKYLNIFAFICTIVKIFFALDRLTILAILFVFFYKTFVSRQTKKIHIISFLFVFFIAIFITALRMDDSGLLNFLIIYFKLSIVNYDLVISNQEDFAYGFQTLLSPLTFVFKFFGYDYIPVEPSKWVWNPAQYFFSYLYMDFGYFSLLFYPLIGFGIKVVEFKKSKGNKFFVLVYFILMFCVLSFISVPIIRGVEFWLMLIVSYYLVKKSYYEDSF